MPSSKKASKRAPKVKMQFLSHSEPLDEPIDEPLDDDESLDDDEELVSTNCSMCVSVVTTRRCSDCGVCVLCSPECEKLYNENAQGDAACLFHKKMKTISKINAFQRDGAESCVMGPVMKNITYGDAVSTACTWMLAYLGLNPNAPLHSGTVLGLSVATIGKDTYSAACKRSLNIRANEEGTKSMLSAILVRLGQLATAQQLAADSKQQETLNVGSSMKAQVFLLGAVTKHARTLKPVLQLDILSVGGARLVDVSTLTCSRDSNSVHNTPFHLQTLHEHPSLTGAPLFKINQKPEPNEMDSAKSLLTKSEIVAALCN